MEAAGKRWIGYPSRSDEFTIWNLADLHVGNRGTAMDCLRRDIRRIADDPFSFWIGGGDYAEYIGLNDKRFDPDCVSEDISVKDMGKLGIALTERVRDLLKPIQHKCMGLLFGNHELQYQRSKQQSELHAWLCTELKVASLGYSALLDVSFCRLSRHLRRPTIYLERPRYSTGNGGRTCSKRFFIHHGAGFAQTPGGKRNRLIQFMDAFQADIYMLGHVHDKKGQRLVTITADTDCKKLVAVERLGIITGTYLRTYAAGVTGYAEQRGYRPVPIGASFVKIKPETGEMRAEV